MKILIALVLLLPVAFCWQEAALGGKSRNVRKGVWGGEHIMLSVEKNQARVEYDCAHGIIDQPMKVDSRGRFKLTGTHTSESGGPDIKGREPVKHPALYTGQLTGNKMVISVTLADTKETIGSFTVTYGKTPDLFKCK